MAWLDTQASGDCIDFSEWNTMIAIMQAHNNTWHSDNYYYQESDLTAVLNDNYPGSSNIYNRTWIDAFSGNLDTRIDAAGGGGGELAGNMIGNISGDSYTYGLKDINFVSSQSVSGGTIVNTDFNTLIGGGNADALHTHTGLASAPGGSMTANVGSDGTFGISGLSFLSSQNISGGTIIGGLHYPADYIIYDDGANYNAKSGVDGDITYTNSDASLVISGAMYSLLPSGGRVFVTKGIYDFDTTLKFRDNISIVGAGIGNTVIRYKDGSSLTSIVNESESRKNISIRDITFDSSGNNDAGGIVFSNPVQNLTITDCEFKNINCPNTSKWVLKIGNLSETNFDASGSHNVNIYNNRFLNCFPKTYEIILAVNLKDSSIHHNYFSGNRCILSDEVSIYPYCDKVEYANNIHCKCSASAVGCKDSKFISIFDNKIYYGNDISYESINCRNSYHCDIHDNLVYGGSNNVEVGIALEDNNSGFDAHTLRHSKSEYINIYNNTISNVKYGIQGYISSTTQNKSNQNFNPRYVSIENNKLTGISSTCIRFGGNIDTIDLQHLYIKNNIIPKWHANAVVGAIEIIGCPDDISKVKNIYIEGNYINSGGTDGVCVRANGCTLDVVKDNYLKSTTPNYEIVTMNNGIISNRISNYLGTKGTYYNTYISTQSLSSNTIDTRYLRNPNNIYIYSGSEYKLRVRTNVSGRTEMYGGNSSGDDFYLIANDSNNYPAIKMLGNGGTYIDFVNNNHVYFREGGSTVKLDVDTDGITVNNGMVSSQVVYTSSLSSQSISGGTFIGNTITTIGRISSSTGLYTHFISANNTNLVGASDYLADNADDTTTGTLTAKSFIGPISSTAISGGSFHAGSATFGGNTISGLTAPIYNSGAANKKYVDDNVGSSQSPLSWTSPTAISGIQLAGVGAMSGALSVGIVDYIASANVISNFVASGVILNSISSQSISGSWTTPIHSNRPIATIGNCGQIIRTSGAADEKTWVWICLKNDANTYEWVQLAMST